MIVGRTCVSSVKTENARFRNVKGDKTEILYLIKIGEVGFLEYLQAFLTSLEGKKKLKCLFRMKVALARVSSGPLLLGTPSPEIFTTLEDKLKGPIKCEKESYPLVVSRSFSLNLSSVYAWLASTFLSRLASFLMTSSLNLLSMVQHTASWSHRVLIVRDMPHQYSGTRFGQYLALDSLLVGEGHDEERTTFGAGEEEEEGQKHIMTILAPIY